MDDNSTPPNMQVQLYPVPDAVYTLPLEYEMEVVPMGATGTILQAWVQPSALIEGATAKIKAHLKDYTGAQFHIATAEAALKKMRRVDAQNMGLAQMALDPYYTSPRRRGRGAAFSSDDHAQNTSMIPNFVDNEIPAGTIDGNNRVFTLADAPNPSSSLRLVFNADQLRPGIDYTLASGTITFAVGQVPQPGDWMLASYRC
jgi:hypothetical protein